MAIAKFATKSQQNYYYYYYYYWPQTTDTSEHGSEDNILHCCFSYLNFRQEKETTIRTSDRSQRKTNDCDVTVTEQVQHVHRQPSKLQCVRSTTVNLYRMTFSCWNCKIIMDARSAMRPCYILPMFFIYFFYGRLSWPNGWTDLHETFTRGRY